MEDAAFFTTDMVEEMASEHLSVILSLEDRQAARLVRSYAKVRQELRDRLTTIPSGSFTAQKMRATLVQLEGALQAMNKNLNADIKEGSLEAAQLGVDNLVKELNKWNTKFTGSFVPINLKTVEIVADTSNLLFNRYDASISSYSEFLRARMAQSLTESVISGDNLSDVTDRLGKTFLAEQWKLEQISRTELHNVYSQGKLAGMVSLYGDGEGTIPDLMKTLFHPMDSRTGKDSIILNSNNPIVPVDEPFVEDSLGKESVYMAPPNRPNDRAILIPYREAWAAT